VIGDSAIVAASAFVKAGMEIPPRTLAAGIPAKVLRALSEQEMAWKIDGTATYQQLAVRSLASLRACTPLTAPEADRRRIDIPGVVPLVDLKKAG
jgi:phenylacetic acid degradation protein